MQNHKWQYLRDDVSSVNDLDEKLAHWGGQGWELVSAIPSGSFEWDGPAPNEAGRLLLIFKMAAVA